MGPCSHVECVPQTSPKGRSLSLLLVIFTKVHLAIFFRRLDASILSLPRIVSDTLYCNYSLLLHKLDALVELRKLMLWSGATRKKGELGKFDIWKFTCPALARIESVPRHSSLRARQSAFLNVYCSHSLRTAQIAHPQNCSIAPSLVQKDSCCKLTRQQATRSSLPTMADEFPLIGALGLYITSTRGDGKS